MRPAAPPEKRGWQREGTPATAMAVEPEKRDPVKAARQPLERQRVPE